MGVEEIILECYLPFLESTVSMDEEEEYKLPAFTLDQLNNLFITTSRYLHHLPALLRVEGPTVIVGDIHGNIRDLIRIIRKNGLPSDFNYVFLGDYVDRGEFSVEVLTLLCALQLTFRTSVVLLRGNHETRATSSQYGFKDEIFDCYGNYTLFESALDLFDNLSLAAVVDKESFCVHGGISRVLHKTSQIAGLVKPIIIESLDEKQKMLVHDMLWADPSESCLKFVENTARGGTVCYGWMAISEFFLENNIKRIIRGHSTVTEGVKCQCRGQVYTVFSSGSYGAHSNCHGYIIINQGIQKLALKRLPQFNRKKMQFSYNWNCKSIAELHSSRPIGPIAINRYWFARRRVCKVGIRGAKSLHMKSSFNLQSSFYSDGKNDVEMPYDCL